MSEYQRLELQLRKARCEKCYGTGKIDDAGPGDMSYNEWDCPDCNGTGLDFSAYWMLKQEFDQSDFYEGWCWIYCDGEVKAGLHKDGKFLKGTTDYICYPTDLVTHVMKWGVPAAPKTGGE